MGFRFRKSIKILPGLRLNLSKSGVSANVGVRGANVSVGKRGTIVNVGLPGTGIGYQERIDSSESQTSQYGSGEQQPAGSSILPRLLIIIAIIVVIAIVAGSQ